jgi:hypothetical protein
MNDATQDLILDEVRALRADVNDIRDDFRKYGERTATLEAQLYPLIGNGTPGRVTRLERAVEKLTQWRWWVIGAAAGSSGVISILAWVISEARK